MTHPPVNTNTQTASKPAATRFVAFLLMAILACEVIESIDCSKYYGRHTAAFQLREKPRATRGFKSVALSTARGFGKRDASFKVGLGSRLPDLESSFSTQKFSQKDSFPVDWLIEEMQNDPELTRTLIKKFIDINQDDEISAEELIRPDLQMMRATSSSSSLSPSSNNLNLEEEQ